MPRKLEHPGSTNLAQKAANKAVKRVNTQPERIIRSLLHRRGYRFLKDLSIKLGDGGRVVRPDIVFVRRKLAIFIDGCFWHSCPTHGRIPNSNLEYWLPKLRGNVARDLVTNKRLEKAGWKVMRFWEHVPPSEIVSMIIKEL